LLPFSCQHALNQTIPTFHTNSWLTQIHHRVYYLTPDCACVELCFAVFEGFSQYQSSFSTFLTF
jgi:hypothetical protein